MDLAFNTIHQGDCIEGLRQLPAGCVDLAFADPPFNIGYDYDVYHDRKGYDHYLDWTRQWMGEVSRVLKPAGTFWIAIGDEYAAEFKLIAQNDLKLTCRSWIIWYYTFGVNCTKEFSRSHAHLFHFVKDRKKYTFNSMAIRVPSARQLVYADGRANPDGRLPDDTWILRPQDVPHGFTPDQDTWYYPRVAGTFKERAGFHGCQMPEQLLGRIIRSCSSDGEVVLDPFTGSGTTLTVAKKLGRQWLGFELSPQYAKKATARIEAAHVGQDLEGAPEPLISAPRTPKKPSRAPVTVPPRGDDVGALINVDETSRALVAAYMESSGGFSIDRVIADSDLNATFIEKCQKNGIPGNPVAWNQSLLALRKAGKLAPLPRTRRTAFSHEELDNYIFASEIAMHMMIDEPGSPSLDDVLCDPELAKRFDTLARLFAPGFSSLQYRWGALTLRKRAKEHKKHAERLTFDGQLRTFSPIAEIDVSKLLQRAGVYLVRDSDRHAIFAGETIDLGRRLHRKLEVLSEWQKVSRKEIQVGLMKTASTDNIFGFKTRVVGFYSPALNLRHLGTPTKLRA